MRTFSLAILAMFLIAAACKRVEVSEDATYPRFPKYADVYEGSLSPVKGQAQKFTLTLISSPIAEREAQTHHRNKRIDIFYEGTSEHHTFIGSHQISRDENGGLNLHVDTGYYYDQQEALRDPLFLEWASFLKSLNMDNPCPETDLVLMNMQARLVEDRIEGTVFAQPPNLDCKGHGERRDVVATVRLLRTRPAAFTYVNEKRIETEHAIFISVPSGTSEYSSSFGALRKERQ